MDPQTLFCPNPGCPARGKTAQNNIVIHSRKSARFQCKICGHTFSETHGTPFYRLRHPQDEVSQVTTLIAYGCPLQAIVVAFGLDERTVSAWQKRAGAHCQQVHEYRVEQPRDLLHVQADEIRVKIQGMILWLAMAIQVSTRLWLGGVVSAHRDEDLIFSIIQMVRRSALARSLLICVDGLSHYVSAIQAVFRSPLPTRSRGRPHLIAWPDIHIAQVIKHHQGKRLVEVVRQMAQGSLHEAQTLLAQSGGGTKLNTAFIERLNETFRAHLSSLTRRGRTLLHDEASLTPLVYLMGSVYNFCTFHHSLRLKLWVGEHGYKWVQRTPAMAAGLTDHGWTVKELLLFRVPPLPWKLPKHRGRRSKTENALLDRWCS
jgi:transposase-like protein